LRDQDVRVRRAATASLAAKPDAAQDREIVARLVELINDPDEATQSSMLPVLINSGDAQGAAAAMKRLAAWLNDAADPQQRALGLRVLARTQVVDLVEQLEPYLRDEVSLVRVQAAEAIGQLAAQTAVTPLRADRVEVALRGVSILHATLAQPDVALRLAVIHQLGVLNGLGHKAVAAEAGRALLDAMRDRLFPVRRAACLALTEPPRLDMEQAYHGADAYQAEGALYVMAKTGSQQIGGTLVQKRLIDHCEELAGQWYSVATYRAALIVPDTSALWFLNGLLQEQAAQLLDRIFWLLGAIYGEEDTATMRRSLLSPDPRKRANALESLEATGSHRLAELIVPLFTAPSLDDLIQIAQDKCGWQVPSVWDALQALWPALRDRAVETPLESSEMLTAAGMLAALDAVPIATQSSAALERIKLAVETELHSEQSLPRETAGLALRRLTGDKERAMLTVIEKVVFLKQVPLFGDLTAGDLRPIAEVTDEAAFEPGQLIITEGEPGDTLYLIVSGKVAVQHRRRAAVEQTLTELAALGPREYFGEMALFDEGPSSADVVALLPTQVLRVRRAPLYALLERQPALTLGLLRVLSRRLRQANELLAKKNESR
jgi:HEAT repeat protein